MAFKNPKTGYFYTELTLPGYGELPRMSLGTNKKTEARQLENAVRELHRAALIDPRLFKLLDALKPRGKGRRGLLTPADVLRASHEADGFERLLRSLDDPMLEDVLDAYLQRAKPTREDRYAALSLKKYASGQRFSFLTEASNVQALLERIEQGEEKLRGSVVRYEKRLISKLLTWKLGRVERDRVFQDVHYMGADDTRRLRTAIITREAIDRLLAELDAGYYKAGDECARLFVEITLTTGADLSPLSRSPSRNLQLVHENGEEWGLLFLEGTKRVKENEGRDRYIWLLPHIFARVKPYWQPDKPDGQIFPLQYSRFYTIWQSAVTRAGLDRAAHNDTPLRPHDLRSVYAMFAEEARIERTKISRAGLGHKRLQMTDRYLLREVMLSKEEMLRIQATVDGPAKE